MTRGKNKIDIINIISKYGYMGVIALLILEFIGFPVPGEPLMAFYGYFTKTHEGSFLVFSIMWAVIGTNIGSSIAYLIGSKFGIRFFYKYGKYIFITKEKLDKTIKLFNKNMVILLLFSRYVPGVRHIVPYWAGISVLSFKKFFLFSFIGSIIWCSSFVGFGYILGENWKLIIDLSHEIAIVCICIAILGGVAYLFRRGKNQKNQSYKN